MIISTVRLVIFFGNWVKAIKLLTTQCSGSPDAWKMGRGCLRWTSALSTWWWNLFRGLRRQLVPRMVGLLALADGQASVQAHHLVESAEQTEKWFHSLEVFLLLTGNNSLISSDHHW